MIIGVLFSILGAGLVGTYILKAVIERIGEGDQSLLFWYLPFLLFGIVGLVAGLGIGAWGFVEAKKQRTENKVNS